MRPLIGEALYAYIHTMPATYQYSRVRVGLRAGIIVPAGVRAHVISGVNGFSWLGCWPMVCHCPTGSDIPVIGMQRFIRHLPAGSTYFERDDDDTVWYAKGVFSGCTARMKRRMLI